MKITVVTPSYNQGQYLEATIESVLSQGIRDLEYIIMDGGSTDGSVEIIKKYAKDLTYWQSEKDGGQTQALSAGFARATGEVLCWLNSDDRYEPGALALAEEEFEANPEIQLLYGDYTLVYSDGREVPKPKISFDFDICLHAFLMIPQPSSFWRAALYERVGGLNSDYQFSFDYDFFLRVGHLLRNKPGSIKHVHEYLSKFRVHDASKSVSQIPQFKIERKRIVAPFGRSKYRPIRKIRTYYEWSRAVWHFWTERGILKLTKENGKA
jgi:glycosyltransferase involved in cell wall biosynthesis